MAYLNVTWAGCVPFCGKSFFSRNNLSLSGNSDSVTGLGGLRGADTSVRGL